MTDHPSVTTNKVADWRLNELIEWAFMSLDPTAPQSDLLPLLAELREFRRTALEPEVTQWTFPVPQDRALSMGLMRMRQASDPKALRIVEIQPHECAAILIALKSSGEPGGNLAELKAEDFGREPCEPPGGWQFSAAQWLRQKAQEQELTNEQCPEHAKAYETWRMRPIVFRHLADELEAHP